jgi:hypothetical protein
MSVFCTDLLAPSESRPKFYVSHLEEKNRGRLLSHLDHREFEYIQQRRRPVLDPDQGWAARITG